MFVVSILSKKSESFNALSSIVVSLRRLPLRTMLSKLSRSLLSSSLFCPLAHPVSNTRTTKKYNIFFIKSILTSYLLFWILLQTHLQYLYRKYWNMTFIVQIINNWNGKSKRIEEKVYFDWTIKFLFLQWNIAILQPVTERHCNWELYKICIFHRSKLRAELTKKSLTRDWWGLSG